MKWLFLVLFLTGCATTNIRDQTFFVHADKSIGTGFLNGTNVYTCYHVIEGASNVYIRQGGIIIFCDVVYTNPTNDVAVLKPHVNLWGETFVRTVPRAGDRVISCANTFALDALYVEGYVMGYDSGYYIVAMPVGRGSSGSAVFVGNKLIGITAAMSSATHAWVIPIELFP